jgi:hypothetical protein
MYKEGVEDYALEYEKAIKTVTERMENLTLFY